MDEELEEKKEEAQAAEAMGSAEAEAEAEAGDAGERELSMAGAGSGEGTEAEGAADTQAASVEGEEPLSMDNAEPERPAEKMIPQSLVNELIGKTRMEARQKARDEYAAEMRSRYGVDTDDDLDGLFGDGQRFSALNDEYGSARKAISDLRTENALLKSGVPEERWEDVKAIAAYNRMEITPETISGLVATHPEWSGAKEEAVAAPQSGGRAFPQAPMAPEGAAKREAPSVISRLGGDPSPKGDNPEADEREKALKMMGF